MFVALYNLRKKNDNCKMYFFKPIIHNLNESGRGGWHAKKNYTQNSTIFTTVACMYRIWV